MQAVVSVWPADYLNGTFVLKRKVIPAIRDNMGVMRYVAGLSITMAGRTSC